MLESAHGSFVGDVLEHHRSLWIGDADGALARVVERRASIYSAAALGFRRLLRRLAAENRWADKCEDKHQSRDLKEHRKFDDDSKLSRGRGDFMKIPATVATVNGRVSAWPA